jgi:hypothetical protein
MTEHYYAPGYGLLFDATWVHQELWCYTIDCYYRWRVIRSEGYDEWYHFATWHELHVEAFHRDYPQHPLPLRSITNEDGTTLARLDWHWTDDEVTK